MKALEALRTLGTGSEPPEAAKQRVYGALLATFAGAPAPSPGLLETIPRNLGPVAVRVTGSAKLLAIATGIWLVGGVTGALLYGALRPVPTRVVYVDRQTAMLPVPALPRLSGTPASTQRPAEPLEPLPSAAPRLAASTNANTRSGRESELARERALLDLARNAASRSEPAAVLAIAEQHRASFPRGRLSEEREALAIRALLALGSRDRARSRADAFRSAFPGSFLLPMLDSAFANP